MTVVPPRMLAVVVPDWPVAAAGVLPDVPGLVLRAGRVVAASPAARAQGVEAGLRRREAQARCPEAVVLAADPIRDARQFEPVALAIARLAPRLEVVEPGCCLLATRGPSRYHGGDEALAVEVRRVATEVLAGRGAVRVGVAEGAFAARLAAAEDAVVPPGATPEFLAEQPVDALPVDPRLVMVLRRLGLRTMGQLAAVPAGDVVARFGAEGTRAHRQASGLDPTLLRATTPTEPVTATVEWDDPVERVDAAVFAARPLAEELCARLAARGEACSRLAVVAETDHGEHLERLWRQDDLTVEAITDRVRWQLDGWLGDGVARRPTAGLILLRLVADEVVAACGTQLDLFGGRDGADDRVVRAVARLSALLGPAAVRVPEWRGSRHHATQLALVPADAVDLARRRATRVPDPSWPGLLAEDGSRRAAPPLGASVAGPAEDGSRRTTPPTGGTPWPGVLPGPAPATVHPPGDRRAVEVLDAQGRPVTVNGRAECSAAPAVLVLAGQRPRAVGTWAGPWPVDERWWDAQGHRRRARFQLVTADLAVLVALEGGRWWLEAVYD